MTTIQELDNQTEEEFKNNAVLQIEQKKGIKLTRNASGIYQWEIKSLSLDVSVVIQKDKEIREELDKAGLKYDKEPKK